MSHCAARYLLALGLGLTLWTGTMTGAGGVQAPTAQPGIDDTALWIEWEQWSAALAPLPVGQRSTIEAAYTAWLRSRGVSPDEAASRLKRIYTTRRGSVERERLFWNVAFKLGGGPDAPLKILQEAVQGVKPGRALDPGMGRGRNAIYLASLGWDVTGYDNAADAITASRTYAKHAGVTITTVLASHDEFDYGVAQWDLIVNAYNYIDPLDPVSASRQWRSLKSGGLIVWQTGGPSADSPEFPRRFAETWKQFRILRLEQPEGKGDDWIPNQPFIRALLRKP